MDKNISKSQYKDAVNLIGHIILTKPKVIRKFLYNHGKIFRHPPSQSALVDAVVALLSRRDPEVLEDFASLVSTHISYKSAELNDLSLHPASQEGEDHFLGAITAGLGIVKTVSSLFKRKKKNSSSSSRSVSQNNAIAAQMKLQMKLQMQELKRQQQQAEQKRQQEEEERRRREREEAERRRQQEAKKKNQVMMIGGAVALVAIAGFMFTQKKRA